jgi:hypothetical protein
VVADCVPLWNPMPYTNTPCVWDEVLIAHALEVPPDRSKGEYRGWAGGEPDHRIDGVRELVGLENAERYSRHGDGVALREEEQADAAFGGEPQAQCHSWISRCNACPAPGTLGGGSCLRSHQLPVHLPRSEAVKCSDFHTSHSTSQFPPVEDSQLSGSTSAATIRSFGSRPSLGMATRGCTVVNMYEYT